jgi:hypothetical protein
VSVVREGAEDLGPFIGDSEPTVAERLGEREIRRDPESMVLLLGAINTS